MAKNKASKTLNDVIQTSTIAALITELDALGYELYIKPKPARHKDLKKQLRDSIKKEEA